MLIKFPKDTTDVRWTRHIKNKMLFYGLSEQRIRGIVRNPHRIEEGIAPETIAVMQSKSSPRRKEEIWVMYQKRTGTGLRVKRATRKRSDSLNSVPLTPNPKILMISAWRYPGITKPGAPVPIPDDIVVELSEGPRFV